ncbi:MAG: UTP--glucose-1-phosphate uridylyltransferase GalU [Oligoflexia bacterium]|nr:UTP--glucose-1-phosphate uridylyltransferase GalU [Oligoflexia bacterium]
MSKTIKKAVIPVAGLGTRFLPASKAIPKEMLPIVDRPIILHIVEEAVAAGVEDVIFVTGRNKHSLEDFFDHNFEQEDSLSKQKKDDLYHLSKKISEMVNVISIRQKSPRGLGHAVLAAKPAVGDEPFVVLLGDEVMFGKPNVTEQLAQVFHHQEVSTIAVMEVPKSDVSKYGIAKIGKTISKHTWHIDDLVEKPKPSEAPSCWALPGRYLFTSDIFKCIEETKPSKNGEIQLTDAMVRLIKKHGLLAHQFTAERYDAGDKLGYMKINFDAALRHPEIGRQFKEYVLERAKTLK